MPFTKGKSLLKKFNEFVSGLKPSDRIALVFDADSDGFTAGVLASKALKILGCNNQLIIPRYHGKPVQLEGFGPAL
ncbi:hypothetical protein HZB89_00920, partial [archaeon]|nr:hypothetical protein [archaeon]